MNCKRIQELIITDYADGEAGEALRKDIEQHLRSCDRCKVFKAVLDKSAIEPFKYERTEMPPERIWHNIKSAIEKEKSPKPVISIIYNLAEFLRPRKAVFALATAAVIMLIVSVFVIAPYNRQKTVNNYLQEQMESFYYLNGNEEGKIADMGYGEFGTSIEEFFL